MQFRGFHIVFEKDLTLQGWNCGGLILRAVGKPLELITVPFGGQDKVIPYASLREIQLHTNGSWSIPKELHDHSNLTNLEDAVLKFVKRSNPAFLLRLYMHLNHLGFRMHSAQYQLNEELKKLKTIDPEET